jgi:3-methyladenine DNA glycosylase AlkD
VEKLITDPEREVHQGMGWFLREAWKISPAEVELFLEKYKDTAPRLIIQYACEKMATEDKMRFKKVK